MDTSKVRPEHRFDEISLDKYLAKHLQGYPSNSNESLSVHQYRYCVFVFLHAQFQQKNSRRSIVKYLLYIQTVSLQVIPSVPMQKLQFRLLLALYSWSSRESIKTCTKILRSMFSACAAAKAVASWYH